MTLDDEIDALWQTPRCLALLEWYQELFPLTDETRPMPETENPNDPCPTCGFRQPKLSDFDLPYAPNAVPVDRSKPLEFVAPPEEPDPWAVPWALIGDKLVREDHVISVGAPDSDGDCLVRWRDGRAFSETSCVRIPFTRFIGTPAEAAAWLFARQKAPEGR